MPRTHTVLVGTALCSGIVSASAAISVYDDNVRATYTKQTYSTVGSIVDVTFKGFSQYGTKVGSVFSMDAVVCVVERVALFSGLLVHNTDLCFGIYS